MDIDAVKQAVGEHAADHHVRSNTRIGMGTGSTAVWAIRRIGALLSQGLLTNILGVPTSFQSAMECERMGIPIRSLNDPAVDGQLDLVIDGADEVDRDHCLTKGGGGALLLEKILAYCATDVVIIADERKLVSRLGKTFPIPIEIALEARRSVMRRIAELGGDGVLRMAERKMGPVITDNGNPILDVTFAEEFDPREMETALNQIPGVLENGLFTLIEPIVYVGDSEGTVRRA